LLAFPGTRILASDILLTSVTEVTNMAWRVVDAAGEKWQVQPAAERRANAQFWQLILSFRASTPERRAFWAAFPIESMSKSSLFYQAERITDEALRDVIAQHLA
jgi:hypothetical protein